MNDSDHSSNNSSKKKREKIRADELTHKLGFAETRTKSQALIMAGQVLYRPKNASSHPKFSKGLSKELSQEIPKVIPQAISPGTAQESPEKPLVGNEWRKIEKAGQFLVESEVELMLSGSVNADVGRGAVKLRGALDHWPQIHVKGARGLDVGSSTGGFTQVLLERGAESVVAMDVGTHQLHEKLRSDKRVVVMEQTHVLKITAEEWKTRGVEPAFDLVVTDLSFISLTKIIPTVSKWLKEGAHWIMLIKPQFEVGPKKAPGGIVRNVAFHQEAIELVRGVVEDINELQWLDVIPSPIKGGDGNVEFLLWLRKTSRES